MVDFIGALDQGTSSTRFIVANISGETQGYFQKTHTQFYPKPGWVEQDPIAIWANSQLVIQSALQRSGISIQNISAISITNQRETTVLWDRATSQPITPAISWMDTRAHLQARTLIDNGLSAAIRRKTGLPIASYFSAFKLSWILNQVPGAREKAAYGEALFGTMDSWIVWNLTGGSSEGNHFTDVTNASRTMLMDLTTLNWDRELLEIFNIPEACLPKILPSVCHFGICKKILPGVPIASVMGDQHASMLGQGCLSPGDAKNTYGTGSFVLVNTGEKPYASQHGLVTTLAYQFDKQKPIYALEGSIAISGSLIQWLRDNLGLIRNLSEIEDLAQSVADNGDIYFVPAFSGLFAPYWREDAQGIIVGLTLHTNRGHIARAALEAVAYQTQDVLEAMNADTGMSVHQLKVDGGMIENSLLMQFQADISNVPVVCSASAEATIMGAVYAAAFSVGALSSLEEINTLRKENKRYEPNMKNDQRLALMNSWRIAVQKSFRSALK
jgi:glycerol kinase